MQAIVSQIEQQDNTEQQYKDRLCLCVDAHFGEAMHQNRCARTHWWCQRGSASRGPVQANSMCTAH